jgi:hypothetical protein
MTADDSMRDLDARRRRKVTMTETALTELWPKLKKLSRIEKLRVMHFLVIELAGEENVALLEDGLSYPIWSPYEAFGAADTLIKVLKEEKPDYGE